MHAKQYATLFALGFLFVLSPIPLDAKNDVERAMSTSMVTTELRRFVDAFVEPALASVQAHEAQLLDAGDAPPSDCFSSAAGKALRWRCCVYFSNIAGALLEARFGALRPARAAVLDFRQNAAHSDFGNNNETVPASAVSLNLVYELTAKWFLANPNDPFALGVRAEQVRSVADVHDQVMY